MKNGISLITLVITIIVVIILAGAVILTLAQNNIIGNANEAVFRNNMAEYQNAINIYIASKYSESAGTFDQTKLNATGDAVESIIPSFNKQYLNEIEISSGKLKYIVTDKNVQEGIWADKIVGIEVEHRTDNIPPTVTFSNLVATGKNITATIEIADDKSGVELTQSKYIVATDSVEYATDNTAWNSAIVLTSNPQNISAVNLAAGDYYVQVLSVDKSGNKKVTISGKVTIINIIQAVTEGQNGTPLSDNATINGGSANYNNPTIPKGFFPVNTTDANWNIVDGIPQGWDNGLVIQDSSGNQFVWVPISADIGVPYQRWCTTGKSNTVTTDVIPMGFNQTGITNTYKGFYISRYEAGFDYNSGNIRPTSKKSVATATGNWSTSRIDAYTGYLWNFINYTDAKSYTENMDTSYGYDTSKLGTSLLTGTAWDTVMKWLQNSTINVAANSTTWGNYANASFTYEWPSTGTKNSGASVLLFSGAANRNKSKNIYDLAGNLREWTSESYTTQFIARGGSYNYYGSDNPAAFRYNYTTSDTVDAMGFRILLYLM